MLSPHQMSSVIITGPNNLLESIIKELHSLKVLHVVEHSKNELADIGAPLESANRLSEILVKVRALMSALKIKNENAEVNAKYSLSDIESTTRRLSHEVNLSLDELKRIEESISRSHALKQELEMLEGIDVPLQAFTAYKSLEYFTGYVKDEKRLHLLMEELPKITNKSMLLHSTYKKKEFIVLFVESKSKDKALEILRKLGFSPVNFINITGNLKGNAASNLIKISEETARHEKALEDTKKKIENLGREHAGFLLAAADFLGEQLEKAEAPLSFASTQSSFLIKGWVPSEDLSKTIEKLNKTAKGKIFVHFEPAKKHDKVPVKLKNPKYAKAFEFFIDLYSMPTYREVDPTFFIFITFPIFFGIMLGDIGYGFTSLIVFWLLKRKMPKAKDFFNILLLASFVSLLFGVFYGEFFGAEQIFGVELPHLLSRVHEMFTLLYIAIGIGFLHVNFGLLVGFINEFKSHGLMTAIYEKASWIVLEVGVGLLALSFFKKIAISPLVGAVFLTASVLMLFKGEGVKGIMELPSIFTNILSYARLMAIGLSSVILAVIINDSAKGFFSKGGFFVVIGVFILIVGHITNIMLGLLGSFLHSLRLHYVEFFSKFFHGGAKKYQPFGMKNE